MFEQVIGTSEKVDIAKVALDLTEYDVLVYDTEDGIVVDCCELIKINDSRKLALLKELLNDD